MSQNNESQQKVTELQYVVDTFVAENLTQEMIDGARLGFGINRELGTRWHQAIHQRGWIAPDWPVEHGGTGWGIREKQVFSDTMALAGAPMIMPFGIDMVGPVIYTFGTQAQKDQHLPSILDGSIWWCQGYSEPGSGSDLASLKTSAVRDGDHYVVNGQKIWTSGAQYANWMFALVRTDPTAPKHQGISFVVLSMDQPGVTVKPIKLISGSSPFCETFFDNAIAKREDLIGELNQGWDVGKRLLQYERNATTRAKPKKKEGEKPKINVYATTAKQYAGEDAQGRIADQDLRADVLDQVMNERALSLTTARVVQESRSSGAPGAATSIFKMVGSSLTKSGSELKSRLRGTAGLVWESNDFSDDELESTRGWLRDRAVTIYGGTNEVQQNIIAKRVLGLPD